MGKSSARKYEQMEEGGVSPRASSAAASSGADRHDVAEGEGTREGPGGGGPTPAAVARGRKRAKVLASAVVPFVCLAALAFLCAALLRPGPAAAKATGEGIAPGSSVSFPLETLRVGDDEPFTFLVVGDWGRQGKYGQRAVAEAMAQVGRELDARFVVSTGDNFYTGGLASTGDPGFSSSFTDVYNDSSLQVPWLAVLGNHDYGDTSGCGRPVEDDDESCVSPTRSPLHQLNLAALRARDWRWSCGRYFSFRPAPGVELFFLDTNPFVSEYLDRGWARGVAGGLSQQSVAAQKAFLEKALRESDAALKIAVGHVSEALNQPSNESTHTHTHTQKPSPLLPSPPCPLNHLHMDRSIARTPLPFQKHVRDLTRRHCRCCCSLHAPFHFVSFLSSTLFTRTASGAGRRSFSRKLGNFSSSTGWPST